MQEDFVHVLMAIIEGLDEHMMWPYGQHSEELAKHFTGIFHGVADVKE